ncbi:MAG TPA: hypothetical protein VFP72_08635 [Kineosporiaceae bacterium]|nr:hypothetical protein [Kineosporiaceae bacterium]
MTAAAIRSGRLVRVSRVVSDPGNPGGVAALFASRDGARALVAVDGTPGPDGTRPLVCVPVPAHFTDPLAAAAWTYDDEAHPVRCTPGVYALLARRT